MTAYTDVIDNAYIKHGARVGLLANGIAKLMCMSEQEIELTTICSLLHDIGKVKIPANIFYKKGPLDKNEMDIIKLHPIYSYEYMKDCNYPEQYAHVVRAHHEKINGSGYPHKLYGEQIPIYARIIAVADIYDALTSDRPYRSKYSHSEAIDIMEAEAASNNIDNDVFLVLKQLTKIKNLKSMEFTEKQLPSLYNENIG